MTETTEVKKESTKKANYFYGVGRRKTASAQVRLYAGKGEITVNKKTPEDYFQIGKGFSSIVEVMIYPLVLTGKEKNFDVVTTVIGGGKSAQVEAIRLGVARALLEVDPEIRTTLKTSSLLTRDAREKERKKVGRRRARRGQQFRKR